MHHCAKCGDSLYEESSVSRGDGKSEICRECGQEEAVLVHHLLEAGASVNKIRRELKKGLKDTLYQAGSKECVGRYGSR